MNEGDNKNVINNDAQAHPEIATSRHLTRLPLFWETNPKSWFVTAEIMFDANKITSDKQKFAHTAMSLTAAQAEKVDHILVDPPVNEKYESLKKALIDRYSISEERKLETLLSRIDLGDQKPSDLLHRIKSLAGKNFSINVITKLWIRQLPDYIQTALIPQQEKPEEDLAEIADKLHDIIGTRTQSLSSINRDTRTPSTEIHVPTDLITQLQQSIKQMSDRLTKLERFPHTQRQPTRSRSPSNWRRSPSPSRRPQTISNQGSTQQQKQRYQFQHNWCWYHAKFGNSASKCMSPCTFTSQKKELGNTSSPNQ